MQALITLSSEPVARTVLYILMVVWASQIAGFSFLAWNTKRQAR